MSSLTTEWNTTFENWQPVRRAEFPCPWCTRGLAQVENRWKHETGQSCLWSEFPLEVSHPFVNALLARIVREASDLHSRMNEFSRVLGMFAPSTPAYM
jgi:hypothetical protein